MFLEISWSDKTCQCGISDFVRIVAIWDSDSMVKNNRTFYF